MSSKLLLFCAVALLAASQALASTRCNLYNFGLQGGFDCAVNKWWKKEDLGQIIDVKYKVSTIVKNSLNHMRVPNPNRHLQGHILASSVDPLSKIIESFLTVEPYTTYVISDLLLSMGVTAGDMKKFGLPADLIEKKNLVKFFTDYIDFSCTKHGIKPVVSCLKTWMSTNCSPEDKPEAIVQLLEKLASAYCSGYKAKKSFIATLTKDLGTVFKSIMDFFKIYRNPQSPYVFDIRRDSWVFNRTLLRSMGMTMGQDCAYAIRAFTHEIPQLVSPTTTLGAGVLAEYFLRMDDSMTRCVLRSMEKFFPGFCASHKNVIRHLNVISDRYSMKRISNLETKVDSTDRRTVTAYGDPHLVPYKASLPVTCSAFGQKIYLINEFFEIQALATPASANRTGATYITKVQIAFRGSQGNRQYMYVANYGSLPTSIPGARDGLSIKRTSAGCVQITDSVSGAVIGIRKFKNNYYFSVRMGKDVLDASLGLLITGCPKALTPAQLLQQKTSECVTACTSVPAIYKNTCIYDCSNTGDKDVAQIPAGVEQLKAALAATDDDVLDDMDDDDDDDEKE